MTKTLLSPAPFNWPQLLVLAAAGFVSVTTELLPVGLLTLISNEFEVSEVGAGLLVAAYSVIVVFTVIPLSRLTSRVPRRRLMVATLIAFLVGTLVLVAAPNFQIALFGRLISGAAHGMLWSVLAPYVSRIVPTKDVTKGLAVMFSGSTLGLAAGTPLGTSLGQLLGWRFAFVVLAGATAVAAILVRCMLPEIPGATPGAHASPLLTALRMPCVMPQLTAWTLQVAAHFGLMTYISSFFAGRGLLPAVTATALSALGLAALAGIWIAGVTAHRLNKPALIISCVMMAACYIALSVGRLDSLWAIILVTIWGTAQSASNVFNQTAVLAFSGPNAEAVNSMVVVAIQIGITAGSIFGGAAVQALGVEQLPLALLVLLTGSLILVVRAHGFQIARNR
ncbi:MFS transporter [Arthrobacter sp. Soil762]|uniref:MFS transporter n=1 Tax=Arthrobacter sp. Soil762 TaxID=1736401 RepID=UPI00138F4F37|nr:MFS transporter [Arthrobacter sp. Soil762]